MPGICFVCMQDIDINVEMHLRTTRIRHVGFNSNGFNIITQSDDSVNCTIIPLKDYSRSMAIDIANQFFGDDKKIGFMSLSNEYMHERVKVVGDDTAALVFLPVREKNKMLIFKIITRAYYLRDTTKSIRVYHVSNAGRMLATNYIRIINF